MRRNPCGPPGRTRNHLPQDTYGLNTAPLIGAPKNKYVGRRWRILENVLCLPGGNRMPRDSMCILRSKWAIKFQSCTFDCGQRTLSCL